MNKETKKKEYKPSSNIDALQPQYIFSLTYKELLVAIAQGLIDPVELAKKELSNRGLDANGIWVGFSSK
jgi:hypothetical protein